MSRKFIHFSLCLVTFLTLSDFVISFFDPLSIGLIAGGASLFYKREKVWEYTYCQVKECCIDAHIPANMTGNYTEFDGSQQFNKNASQRYHTTLKRMSLVNTSSTGNWYRHYDHIIIT